MTAGRLVRFAAFALVSCAASAKAEITLLHAGELLAVPGERPRSAQSVVIEDGMIKEVRGGYADPATFGDDVRVVDLRNAFVLPGLMDMHVHLQFEVGPDNDRDRLKMPPQLRQMRSIHYAMKTLLAGFTTMRDLGSLPQEIYALRDAIERGWIDGPRIIAAGGVRITGGAGDISGVQPELMELWTSENVCDGPYDCRRATRNAIKYGADLIKIASTGGILSDRATGTGQLMEPDELREVVQAAQRMGRKVASHAHQEDGIIAALEAGVDSIEHGTYAGPEAIRLFKETGAYLVPTLLAIKTVAAIAVEADYMPDAVKEKAIRVGKDTAGNFAKVHSAGVNIAYGTDSGISAHGTNAEEAVLMVESGMSEMAVLVAATINAADLIGMSEELGTIEPGKHADLIAVNGSPLENIDELLDVDFVMKGGKVFKH